MRNENVSFERLINVLDYLVDERVGIVHHIEVVPREAGAPDFFHVAAQACNTQAFSRFANFRAGGGASADRGTALAKAVGEAVERYCSAIYDIEDLPLSSYDAASFPCIAPDKFALYTREQYEQPGFQWVPFDKTTPVRWTQALDPATGEICYVPAAMVFMPYHFYQGTGDAPIVQPISTGLACHSSLADAANVGICEVIERDAFTITWQARLAMPQIRIETLSDPNYDLVERFERTGNSVILLNITMEVGVPTVLAVWRSESLEAPPLVFAAAADLDPERAVQKSLEELAHTRRYFQQLQSNMPPLAPDPNHDNVVDQVTHLNFWCDHNNASLANFIFTSEDRIEFDDIENLATNDPMQNLEILVNKVRAINHRVLLADLTTPDVRELGLAVVRAIIPGFHPLFMGHRIRALGGNRLWEVPQKLGYQGITRESGDNPAPHPYP